MFLYLYLRNSYNYWKVCGWSCCSHKSHFQARGLDSACIWVWGLCQRTSPLFPVKAPSPNRHRYRTRSLKCLWRRGTSPGCVRSHGSWCGCVRTCRRRTDLKRCLLPEWCKNVVRKLELINMILPFCFVGGFFIGVKSSNKALAPTAHLLKMRW